MANTIKSRILLKTDTTENWSKATNFVPQLGEVCIYSDRIQLEDGSYIPGVKVGDGDSLVGELEFIGDEYISKEEIDTILGTTGNSSSGSERENNLILGGLTSYSNENVEGEILKTTPLNSSSLLEEIYLPNVSYVPSKSNECFSEASSLKRVALKNVIYSTGSVYNYTIGSIRPDSKTAGTFALYTNGPQGDPVESIKNSSYTFLRNKMLIRNIEDWSTPTFNFVLDGTTYQAGHYMTWKEWCNSNYNTGGYFYDFDTNYIKNSSNYVLKYGAFSISPASYVNPNNLIGCIDNYIWEEPQDNEPA